MRAFLPLLLTLAIVAPATVADHCETYTTTEPEVTLDGAGLVPTRYVDNDFCNICDMFSIWAYEESNGIPGLQRGDEVVDDTCHASIPADTITL